MNVKWTSAKSGSPFSDFNHPEGIPYLAHRANFTLRQQNITFPSGKYEALRIEIGEAKGQNWWCVLYPNLCFIDAVHAVVPEEGKRELKEVLEEDTYEMVTATSRFKIGWFFF